jgi:hypothetical protein
MGLTSSYLSTTKNLNSFLNAIISAKAPERFTNKFLTQLEFASSNDRLFIGILKALGFIDDTAVPTQRYYDFLDQSISKEVLAEGIREAYSDLFSINTKANNMTVDEVKNKLKTLTQGQKSDNVISLMANTFKSLCEYASWGKKQESKIRESLPIERDDVKEDIQNDNATTSPKKSNLPQLHYNIQIILPESRDPLVYDAIFRSLREHIM